MKRTIAWGAAVGLSALVALPALASAQAARTWVSGTGEDTSPCSRTAPCKTFAGAYSKTSVSGEIDALDPGGFGALTITHSINILAEGVLAGVQVSGTNGITIDAPGASVSLRGLDIDGAQSGLNGLSVINAGNVYVENCSIYGFAEAGVLVSSMSATRVDLRNVSIYQNAFGLQIDGSSAQAVVLLEDSALKSNRSANAQVDGAKAALTLSNDTVVGANPGITTSGGAVLRSFGNNRLNNATPTATSLLQ